MELPAREVAQVTARCLPSIWMDRISKRSTALPPTVVMEPLLGEEWLCRAALCMERRRRVVREAAPFSPSIQMETVSRRCIVLRGMTGLSRLGDWPWLVAYFMAPPNREVLQETAQFLPLMSTGQALLICMLLPQLLEII